MARWGPPTLFTIPVLRYITTYGTSHERLAMVSVVQREWAAMNPRATFKTPITVGDVLNSWMIAGPFRLLQRCLVTDGRRPEYETAGRNQRGVIPQDKRRQARQEGPTKKEAPDRREDGEPRGCGRGEGVAEKGFSFTAQWSCPLRQRSSGP